MQPARPHDVVYSSMTLDIEVGKTLALVGPSGGGKSTATKLLLRFYDPTSGCVKMDGMDIRSLNVAWYRKQVMCTTINIYLVLRLFSFSEASEHQRRAICFVRSFVIPTV